MHLPPLQLANAHPGLFAWHFLAMLPLLGFLIAAAVIDTRSRRIPNWLTFTLLGAGLLRGMLGLSGATPDAAVLGMLTGFALLLVMYVLGAVGAGDVKLMAAAGAWLGPGGVLALFLAASVVGLVVVLAQSARAGRLRELLGNTGLLVLSATQVVRISSAQANANARAFTTIDRPLPYAVPVLIGTLMLLGIGWA